MFPHRRLFGVSNSLKVEGLCRSEKRLYLPQTILTEEAPLHLGFWLPMPWAKAVPSVCRVGLSWQVHIWMQIFLSLFRLVQNFRCWNFIFAAIGGMNNFDTASPTTTTKIVVTPNLEKINKPGQNHHECYSPPCYSHLLPPEETFSVPLLKQKLKGVQKYIMCVKLQWFWNFFAKI